MCVYNNAHNGTLFLRSPFIHGSKQYYCFHTRIKWAINLLTLRLCFFFSMNRWQWICELWSQLIILSRFSSRKKADNWILDYCRFFIIKISAVKLARIVYMLWQEICWNSVTDPMSSSNLPFATSNKTFLNVKLSIILAIICQDNEINTHEIHNQSELLYHFERCQYYTFACI